MTGSNWEQKHNEVWAYSLTVHDWKSAQGAVHNLAQGLNRDHRPAQTSNGTETTPGGAKFDASAKATCVTLVATHLNNSKLKNPMAKSTYGWCLYSHFSQTFLSQGLQTHVEPIARAALKCRTLLGTSIFIAEENWGDLGGSPSDLNQLGWRVWQQLFFLNAVVAVFFVFQTETKNILKHLKPYQLDLVRLISGPVQGPRCHTRKSNEMVGNAQVISATRVWLSLNCLTDP